MGSSMKEISGYSIDSRIRPSGGDVGIPASLPAKDPDRQSLIKERLIFPLAAPDAAPTIFLTWFQRKAFPANLKTKKPPSFETFAIERGVPDPLSTLSFLEKARKDETEFNEYIRQTFLITEKSSPVSGRKYEYLFREASLLSEKLVGTLEYPQTHAVSGRNLFILPRIGFFP